MDTEKFSNLEKLINEKLKLENLVYLKEAKLHSFDLTLYLSFVYADNITLELKEKIYGIVRTSIPDYITAIKLKVSRLYFDDAIITGFIKKYLYNSYPAVSAAVSYDIKIENAVNGYKISIDCDKDAFFYIEKYNIANVTASALKNEFHENFSVVFNKSDIISLKDLEIKDTHDEVITGNKRLIHVFEPAVVIGSSLGCAAFYICDIKQEISSCILCGKISNFNRRISKNEKVMYTFDITDFTGKMRCLVFPSKKNAAKMDILQDGADVIVGGNVKDDKFGGGFCMMAASINLCKLPRASDFEIKPLNIKTESREYKTIFPEKVMQSVQSSLFENISESFRLKDKIFVVFDIETTGLKVEENHKITEIGAVKILNGVMMERFSTLIDPEVEIPDSITKLTGITDEMVKGKPKIEDVLPDFFKFTRNCALVAHNIDFDFKFIQSFAKKQGYYFDNEIIDTVSLGRAKVPGLSNYKLQTLANALKVPLLNHHRAVDDAVACAEIFLKLNA